MMDQLILKHYEDQTLKDVDENEQVMAFRAHGEVVERQFQKLLGSSYQFIVNLEESLEFSRENGDPYCNINDFGIYLDSGFVQTTTKVSAEKKLKFGVSHTFGNIDKEKELTLLISKPGENAKESMPIKELANFSIFRFDVEEEMIPGEWLFEFTYQERVLCKQSFEVYKRPNKPMQPTAKAPAD